MDQQAAANIDTNSKKETNIAQNSKVSWVSPVNDSLAALTDTKARLDDYFATSATLPLSWRKHQLNAFLKLLRSEEKAITTALYQDLHKSEEEAFITEVGYLTKDVKYLLSHIDGWAKPRSVGTPLLAMPGKSMIKAEPLGTCLVIGAWNYPFQLALSPMLAAISAGNCVIIKPSELAPATSALIAKLLPKYLDMNAIAVVEGGKEPTSELLSLAFDKVFYTGGEKVGKIVMRAAAEHLTPVTLELGGKSPCIVDKNIDLSAACSRIVWGKLMNAGQTCIAPDYLMVHHSHLDDVVNMLKKVIVKQYSKDIEKNKYFGRIISQAHAERLVGYLKDQNIVFGGEHDVSKKFIAPTIVLNPSPDSPLMQEEIFGPIIPIVSFNGRSDMLAFIRQRAKPLAAYVFTKDKEFEQRFVDQISAGNMCINDTCVFMVNPELPFGGVGISGMGRYHGKYGFDTFSHQKSILKRSFSLENSLRYMPFNAFKFSLIRRFLK
ncbi:aldehyde dehydrogenase [Glaciecola punicea ACAM 611]|jgi:aldehyde dehydrogenase (NAD+)|uniref:Aldehyde dehydrogenase n=1 Tax=Glaciecola punicea ACAM 611 TaxID=1121923 RepID=H5TFE0_9ALTE|nr:aldehyde dehydrogenase family protein [Glaciecola punicea]OFA32633.1 aldehyde dehydrogenase [Glaciecola punicea]GAB56820.1 aldehyde dehydrogenase [Glaciecola punicea ACAM 611]